MGLLSGRTPRETAVAWAFVAAQGALLVALALLPAGDAWYLDGAAAGLARALQWVGLVVLVVGLANLGRSLTPLPVPVPHGALATGGLFRLVRHPIYAGILALAAGLAARSGNPWTVATAVGLAALFAAKARWEEARLRERYPGYDAYAARTPRFVPGWPFGADRRR